MLSKLQLQDLMAQHHEDGIVSVYLRLDRRSMREPQHVQAEFKSALKRFERGAAHEKWSGALAREKPRILEYLSNWRPQGSGLAIFASEPAQLWEAIVLPASVPNMVQIDTTPHAALLARILEEMPRSVVVLVQRDRANIYISDASTSDQVDHIETDVPARHDQGGMSQARFQRHVEYHVAEHLKKVVGELHRLLQEQPFESLLIGGTTETVHEVVEMLPDPLKRRLVATFPFDAKHATETENLEHARSLLQEHERRTELELVEKVISAAKSGGRGVLGLDPTLEAVVEQRVQILTLPDQSTHEGSECTTCGYLAARRFDRCPICAGETETTDVVERAVERVLLESGDIEVVFGPARDRLQAAGGIGALLRY